MRVAVVGSRDYPDLARVGRFVGKLPAGTVVISGGAEGVDRRAAACARSRGLPVVEHFADWSRGRGAGYVRNKTIVLDAQLVVAFWDLKSRGTANAIVLADRGGRKLRVCGPDGIEIPTAAAVRAAKAVTTTPEPEPRGFGSETDDEVAVVRDRRDMLRRRGRSRIASR